MNPNTKPLAAPIKPAAASPAPPKAPNSFTQYNSLDGANEGLRMVIMDPAGQPTPNWLHVLGTDSQAYQTADRTMRRAILAFVEAKGEAVKKTDEYGNFVDQQIRGRQAALISSWSFDEPCTPENVLALLTIAPGVSEQVDDFAGKRSRFVKA